MSIQLSIYTTDKITLDEKVKSVRLPGVAGSFEVLQGHASMLSTLNAGIVTYCTHANKMGTLPVEKGVVKVANNRVQVYLL